MPGQSGFLDLDEVDARQQSSYAGKPGYGAPQPLHASGSLLPAPGDSQPVGGMFSGGCHQQPACNPEPACAPVQPACDTASAHVGFNFHFNPSSYCPCIRAWKPCALLAEFIGTAVLVFMIASVAACTCGVDDLTGLLLAKIVVGLVAGWVLFFLVATWGPISGGHFNPHVTLAMLLCGKINLIAACLYVLAQFLGAVVAGALLLIFYDSYHCCLGTPQLAHGVSIGTGLAAEIIGTTVLVLMILLSVEYNPATAPLAIGLTLGALQLVFLSVTGASFNFFRYLGPAIFSQCFDDWWIYLVGPIIGGLIGWGVYKACLALRCYGKGSSGSHYSKVSSY